MKTIILNKAGIVVATLPILYDPPSQSMTLNVFDGDRPRTVKAWITEIRDVVQKDNQYGPNAQIERTITIKE